jgi:hypothetical protein
LVATLPGIEPYAPNSLHLSLLALTARGAPTELDDARVARVAGAAVAALEERTDRRPVVFALGGVGLVGTQLFVEARAPDERWAAWRTAVADAAAGVGEQPLVHPDPEPVHLNVARLGPASRPALVTLAARLRAERHAVETTVEIDRLEVVVTDFVVSPHATRTVAAVRLEDRAISPPGAARLRRSRPT